MGVILEQLLRGIYQLQRLHEVDDLCHERFWVIKVPANLWVFRSISFFQIIEDLPQILNELNEQIDKEGILLKYDDLLTGNVFAIRELIKMILNFEAVLRHQLFNILEYLARIRLLKLLVLLDPLTSPETACAQFHCSWILLCFFWSLFMVLCFLFILLNFGLILLADLLYVLQQLLRKPDQSDFVLWRSWHLELREVLPDHRLSKPKVFLLWRCWEGIDTLHSSSFSLRLVGADLRGLSAPLVESLGCRWPSPRIEWIIELLQVERERWLLGRRRICLCAAHDVISVKLMY